MTSNENSINCDDIETNRVENNEEIKADSDEEDDCEGYFLEPSANAVNIAERIAEANRRLYEEERPYEENENRLRKVQFSEQLVDFEPSCYNSDDDFVESGGTSSNSEEDSECKADKIDDEKPNKRLDRPKTANRDIKNKNLDSSSNETGFLESESSTKEETEDAIDEIEEDVVIQAKDLHEKCNELEGSEIDENDICHGNNSKLLLVLLPRDQSSSCESVIGEDVQDEERTEEKTNENNANKELEEIAVGEEGNEWKSGEETVETKEENLEADTISKPNKITNRPKSANNSKHRKKASQKACRVSKISPNLNYSHEMETKKWTDSRNQKTKLKSRSLSEEQIKAKGVSKENKMKKMGRETEDIEDKVKNGKVNIINQNFEEPKSKRKSEEVLRETETNQRNRPKSSYNKDRPKEIGQMRPRTAPTKRACCVIRTDLPRYNGLRSEYGLSAEQLQERRRLTFELKQKKRLDKYYKRQDEIQKRIENEQKYNQWLHSKSKRSRNMNSVMKKSNGLIDTLSRSDVYIQNHAVYASRRGISYSVDYSLRKNKNYTKSIRLSLDERRHERTINLERLFDNVSPHVKRTYRIYLGLDSRK